MLALFVAGCAAPLDDPDSAGVGVDVPGALETSPGCRYVHGLDNPCAQDGLHVGELTFWNGTNIPTRSVESLTTPPCTPEAESDHVYSFEVAPPPPGAQLHVGIQLFIRDLNYVRPFADVLHYGHETGLFPSLLAPDGSCAAIEDSSGLFGVRMDVPAQEGRWHLQVDGLVEDVVEYRVRALVHVPDEATDVALPDLRIIAPFEISFFVPTATILPGAPLPVGLNGASCMAEELQEAAVAGIPIPTLCLRFSMGLSNAAQVPFVLSAERSGIMADAGLEDVPLRQVQCSAAGTGCEMLPEVDGLVARWHETHFHYHYQNAYVFDLYEITGKGPLAMEKVGTSGKLGLDPTNEAWYDWFNLGQGPQWGGPLYFEDAASVPISQRIQPGWGDIYDWNRAGNYIDFPKDVTGLPKAGEYVIQGVTDPLGQIVESNETNNVAYAHFTVSGAGAVDVHERGFGEHPWDPAKTLIDVAP